MSETDFDVAVIGGGVVGLLSSLLFAEDRHRVALVAPGLDAAAQTGAPGARCYAIAPGARAVLEAAGAWKRVDATRCGSFSRMEVWDAASIGRIRFDPPVTARDPMGHIVEHANLVHALARSVEASAGITMFEQPLTALSAAPNRRVVLAGGAAFRARLIAGADGADSSVRTALGIEAMRTDYGQTAIVCNVSTTAAHAGVARQRFLSSGPLAFLPLPDPHACSIVWTATTELARDIAADSDAGFRARLTDAIGGVMGTVTSADRRVALPLERLRAARMVDDGAALLGDAAHVVHPLAGQGLNLGIMDAASLAECVGRTAGRAAWPRLPDLKRYERWRQSEALAMTVVTDSLKRLFERTELPVRFVRGVGMRLTDGIAPLKRWLIARAMGLEGDLPRRARQRAA